MLMATTAALPATIPSVTGVSTPTIHPPPAAIVAASVAEAANHNQKDTTFTKIFVGGLPYHTNDKSLREHFEVFGEIDEAVVITDRQTGKSRGYGFVTMADRSGAERAIKDPNPVIDGRKANVNLAYIGAKPRGTPASSFASLAPAAMRVYSHLGGASSPYSCPVAVDMYSSKKVGLSDVVRLGKYYDSSYVTDSPSRTDGWINDSRGSVMNLQPPTNYVYQLPYTSAAHFPLISTQAAHLNHAAAAAATVGYTPADYTAGAAAYTAAAYPGAPTALDHYGIPTAFSPASAAAGLQGYNYAALNHAAAATAASTFGLGAYPSPVAAAAAAAAAAPQSALQEARMQ